MEAHPTANITVMSYLIPLEQRASWCVKMMLKVFLSSLCVYVLFSVFTELNFVKKTTVMLCTTVSYASFM